MSPADAQWRWFLQRAMQQRLQQRDRQDPINITVVVKHEGEERPRETPRVRHWMPSPG
jgi:hypothetical protein